MTFQEKLKAKWADAQKRTADKRNNLKFAVFVASGVPNNLVLKGNDPARNRFLRKDADGDPALAVFRADLKSFYESQGWALAPKPAARPAEVEAADEETAPKRRAKPKADETA